MTFKQVAASLPNGFHDAELRRFEMDYVRRRLEFDLDVWIGDMDNQHARELYRPAQLVFHDVAFLVVESPDTGNLSLGPGPIRIDAGEGQPEQSSSGLPDAPVGTSVVWMFLVELNRFLLFAAGNVSFYWAGPEENRN